MPSLRSEDRIRLAVGAGISAPVIKSLSAENRLTENPVQRMYRILGSGGQRHLSFHGIVQIENAFSFLVVILRLNPYGFEEEPAPPRPVSIPGACASPSAKAPRPLKVRADVEHRSLDQSHLPHEQRDEHPAHPAIAIKKRMERPQIPHEGSLIERAGPARRHSQTLPMRPSHPATSARDRHKVAFSIVQPGGPIQFESRYRRLWRSRRRLSRRRPPMEAENLTQGSEPESCDRRISNTDRPTRPDSTQSAFGRIRGHGES